MPNRIENPISGTDVLQRLMARFRDFAPSRTVSFGHGLFVPAGASEPLGVVRRTDSYDLYRGALVLRALPPGLRTWIMTTCERDGVEERAARSLRLELFTIKVEQATPDPVLRAVIGRQLMQATDHRERSVPNTLLWSTDLGRLYLSPVPYGKPFRRFAGSASPGRCTHPGPDGGPPVTYPTDIVDTFERALKQLMGFDIA